MYVQVRPAQILLRGDERYNPRFTQQPELLSNGATRITGVMKPDSPKGVAVKPQLPDLPFQITIPAHAGAAEYHTINTEIWSRIQKEKSLLEMMF